MRVLVIHNYYGQWGGGDAAVRADIAELQRRGHEVSEYSRRSGELAGGWRRLAAAAASFHSPRMARDVGRLARAGVDVAHVHNFMPLVGPSVFPALRRNRIPVVLTAHDYRMMCVNGIFYTRGAVCRLCAGGNFLHSIPRRCHPKGLAVTIAYAAILQVARAARVFARYVDVYLAVSEFVKSELRALGIPGDRIIVKGNLQDPPGPPSFEPGTYGLYLGRLAKEKGVWTLLRALDGCRGLRFRIAGTGPEEESLRRFVRDRGVDNVEFLGFVPGDKRFDLLRRASYLVVPSECHETFGLSALEALSVGTPVIATRMGGLPELVIPGVGGALVDAGDAEGLKAAMSLMDQEGPGLRRSARSRYESYLASDRGGGALERAYALAREIASCR